MQHLNDLHLYKEEFLLHGMYSIHSYADSCLRYPQSAQPRRGEWGEWSDLGCASMCPPKAGAQYWHHSQSEDQQRICSFSKINTRHKGFEERLEELKVCQMSLAAANWIQNNRMSVAGEGSVRRSLHWTGVSWWRRVSVVSRFRMTEVQWVLTSSIC